jgi:hypothetical protein
MAHLKYYLEERMVFPEANKKSLNNTEEIRIVFRKLVRHFKIGKHKFTQPSLFFGRRNCANDSRVKVTVPSNFLILCHEIAHVKHIRKVNHEKAVGKIPREKKIRYHGKQHFRIMKSMIKYCERKKWFEAELQRRTAPKPAKPEPSEQEKESKELEKVKLKIRSWEGKRKRAENKLKKLRRKEKSIQSRISTPQLPSHIDNKINQGEDSREPPHKVSIPVQVKAD